MARGTSPGSGAATTVDSEGKPTRGRIGTCVTQSGQGQPGAPAPVIRTGMRTWATSPADGAAGWALMGTWTGSWPHRDPATDDPTSAVTRTQPHVRTEGNMGCPPDALPAFAQGPGAGGRFVRAQNV